jgi:hypothetical protein
MNNLLKRQQAVKKPYASPKLIRHGDVRCLTQGGSQGNSEKGNPGDKNKKL